MSRDWLIEEFVNWYMCVAVGFIGIGAIMILAAFIFFLWAMTNT